MNDKDFRALVRDMRTAQKRYFSTREVDDLRASKDLERRVDVALQVSSDLFSNQQSSN